MLFSERAVLDTFKTAFLLLGEIVFNCDGKKLKNEPRLGTI
ncbi:hypothetical protein MCERE19_03630 [Spirosomataceae bacterium]|jgi:hypothetical protein